MIIGLTGYARSGKDTIAAHLVEKHGFVRLAFADKLKQLAYEANPSVELTYGLIDELESVGEEIDTIECTHLGLKYLVDTIGWEATKQADSVRTFLQNLGVAARNTFGPNFWIQQLEEQLVYGGPNHYVISDVRFLNEAAMIQRLNGEIWRVIRPGVTAINWHVSELEMDAWDVDVEVPNIGEIEDLHRWVDGALAAT